MRKAVVMLSFLLAVMFISSLAQAGGVEIRHVHMLGSDVEYPFITKFTVEFNVPTKAGAYWQVQQIKSREGTEAQKLDDLGRFWIVTLDMRIVREPSDTYAKPIEFCIGYRGPELSAFKRFSIRKREWMSPAEQAKYPGATPLEIVSLESDEGEEAVKHAKVKRLIPLK